MGKEKTGGPEERLRLFSVTREGGPLRGTVQRGGEKSVLLMKESSFNMMKRGGTRQKEEKKRRGLVVHRDAKAETGG